MRINISPIRGKATRVDWNATPLPTQPIRQWMSPNARPSPSPSRRRKAFLFVLPIVIALLAVLLTGCESGPNDIAQYSPRGRSGQSAQQPTRIPPTIPPLPATEVPPTPAPIASYVSVEPTPIPVSSALSQSDLAQMVQGESGPWIVVSLIAGAVFLMGVVVGIVIGGGGRG